MNRTIYLILALGTMLLKSCIDDSISMNDYYYPLHEIDQFMVFDYDREDQKDNETDTSKFYYKIYRIDDNTYSIISLDEQLYLGDSIILKETNDAIIIENNYRITPRGYDINNETRQVLYPFKTKLGDKITTTFTYDSIAFTHDTIFCDRYETEIISETSKLISFDQEMVEFENEMTLNLLGVKENDNSSKNLATYTVKYKRNKGFHELSSTTGAVKTKLLLNRIWSEKEWEENTVAKNK